MGCCLQSQRPQVSSQRAREAAPSLLRRASGRAPRPKRGAAGGGEGRARERGVGDPEGEEQECAASSLPFSKQRCHTRRTLRFLGLWRESRAGGRAGGSRGTTQVSPRPRPLPGRGGRRGSRSPAPRDPHGGFPESHTFNHRTRGSPLPLASPSAPTPGFQELLHFPKPTGAPTPALHPRPINCASPLREKKK